ncbi:hypothetical protein [Limnofasciculus baicalensis]|uniref:Uncharacterized protein n=1 Tax=Limnofasciculus baicalensis BBK-W-15 TaxID=2699891 RepID=A0AAE3KQL6_9CYAN|nr:hypothetical protein [Limnofasciculus baicalensis]MCP2732615.1 hypothetical protein [Limnofasciculus baicalensis BBK-W-15]
MDTVQKEIIALSHKLDLLYQIMEQRSKELSGSLSEIKERLQADSSQSSGIAKARSDNYHSPYLLDSVMDHKDILTDSNSDRFHSPQNGDKPLSDEIQVQRLTAQLTAAYNRIAALEEQLLVRRIQIKA